MGVPTYQPIANIFLSSSTGSVTFSNITQQYTDLVLVAEARTTIGSNNEAIVMRINGDSLDANYSSVRMIGTGSGTSSDTIGPGGGGIDIGFMPANNSSSNVFGTINLSIMDYSSSSKHKTSLNRWGTQGSGSPLVTATATRWASNSPITWLSLIPGSDGSIPSGTRFKL